MTLNDLLLGSRLKNLDHGGMTVVRNGKDIYLSFDTDNGDCCGYAEIESTLCLESLENAPAITRIERAQKTDDCGGDSLTITLLGGAKRIATIDACAGSGSGWCYGAVARVVCLAPNLDEVLASW